MFQTSSVSRQNRFERQRKGSSSCETLINRAKGELSTNFFFFEKPAGVCRLRFHCTEIESDSPSSPWEFIIVAELTWHRLTCLNKGDVNELNSTLQADNAASALAVRTGISLICFNSVAIWLNARQTLILKPIKFWIHVKSFSYEEWPEYTKTMLTIHNADELLPNALIQTRWPTINFEFIIIFIYRTYWQFCKV